MWQRAHVCQFLAVLQERLGAVMHAGGVLRDAAFLRQDLRQLREVLASKASAARLLGGVSWAQCLQTEVNFSSLSALMGTAGQGNYAAANMALNQVSQQRQLAGSAHLIPQPGEGGGGG